MAFPVILVIPACAKSPPPAAGGKGDNSQTAHLTVDEAGITGQVAGDVIHLQIPVSNRDTGQSAGSLKVAIINVDGTKTNETQAVPFQLGPGESRALSVDFRVLPDVANQPDWVKSSVLITSPEVKDLRVTRSLLTALGNYEVRIEGPTNVTRGRQASYRVRTQDPVTFQVLPNAPVQLIVRKGDQVVSTQDAITSDKGDAVFDVVLDTDGAVTVEARAKMQGTNLAVSDSATVKVPGNRVLLTTDKPIYQPGQTIYLRALALENQSKKPLSGQAVLFEIEDGKANKILKRTLTSDSYGLASAKFKLGDVLNMGTFKVRVTVGADKSEKTVEVSRYALPKFKVDVGADKPWYTPGAIVTGAIDARYFFGKALDGAEVQIQAATMDIGQTVFQKVIGKTDANGRYAYSVQLPTQLVGLPINDGNATINLSVQVTDTAGQKVVQEKALTVASKGMRLAL
ncbi:MAG TPA: MG2 domain-containing protein, partial [Polyangia bacterium]